MRDRKLLRSKVEQLIEYLDLPGSLIGTIGCVNDIDGDKPGDVVRQLLAELAVPDGFRVSPDLDGRPTLWCVACGRDSGFHWKHCARAEKPPAVEQASASKVDSTRAGLEHALEAYWANAESPASDVVDAIDRRIDERTWALFVEYTRANGARREEMTASPSPPSDPPAAKFSCRCGASISVGKLDAGTHLLLDSFRRDHAQCGGKTP